MCYWSYDLIQTFCPGEIVSGGRRSDISPQHRELQLSIKMADAASNPETPLQQTAVNGDTDVTDVDLTEEKSAANPDFKGATLELNSSGNMDTEVGFAGPGLDPPKPMPTVTQEVEIREASSRGTLSRSSTTSLGSRTSFSSAVRTGDCNPENYFCTKVGVLWVVTLKIRARLTPF